MGFFKVQQLLSHFNSMAIPTRTTIVPITPWHGIIRFKEFLPLAFPIARKAFGWPVAFVISL